MLLAFACCNMLGCDDAVSNKPAPSTNPVSIWFETVRGGAGEFVVVHVDPSRADLKLFWKDEDGRPFTTFRALEENIKRQGDVLTFAANAGIFDPSLRPIGLHVEDGTERVPLNDSDGEGNFFLKPNGVFADERSGHAIVVESSRFALRTSSLKFATQSGPMLVIDGTIHPAFDAASENRKIRSAVGIAGDRDVVFVLSRAPLTFHEIALFMRDKLGCRNALYLDGVISKFYAPKLELNDAEGQFAGLLAVVERRP